MKDFSLLAAETAIDPAKLRRQRNFWRAKEVEKQTADMKELMCIGFDGKQDITLAETSGVRRKVKEEHYAIILYPDKKYIDHVMPESGKASDIAKEIISTITETNSLQTLSAVVCDGTVNNTGKWSGVIRRLEEGVGRPLQWLVCLLHANELPFRKYMSVVDGGCTTGPSSSTGEVSMALAFDPKDFPIENFKAIDGKVTDVSDDVMKAISNDNLEKLNVDSFKGIPCHSQAVERCIKDISATTSKVFGHKSRHGMIMQCTKSRAELSKVDCKSDFLQ